MSILLWLLPAALATLAAMLVAGWVGRERPEREQSEADRARLGAALARPLPRGARPRPGADARRAQRERSTGVAPRRSPARGDSTRRSA